MNYAQDRLDRRARYADSSSSDSLWADYQKALSALLSSSSTVSEGHELLGRTLRDVGWCRHAAFHYGMAFHQRSHSFLSVGDYAQVLEFAGMPELGVLVLMYYRSEQRHNVADINGPIASQTPSDVKGPSWLRQNPPPTSDCGCGHAECGRRIWFLDESTVLPVVNALDDYQESCGQRMADMQSTNTIHALLAKSKVIDTSCSVPELLQFWKTSETFVDLEPVLQLLLVKLLYVTIPSLAAEAVIHLHFDSPRQLANDFKSHMAYYVMIRALVLGERIKRERRLLLGDSYPVPVWDLLWNKDRRPVDRDVDNRFEMSPTNQMQWNDIAKCALHDNDKLPVAQWSLPLPQHYKPLFVIGDSHVLSIAWATIFLPSGEPRLVVPLVVTGLKAWHTRQDTFFFAHSLLHSYLNRLPPDTDTILLSAGEIDCREGIGGPLLEGYKLDYQEHVQRTVGEYVKAVSDLAHQYSLQVLIMPVAPHAHRSDRNGKSAGRAFRRHIMQAWNKELRTAVPQHGGVFLLDYEERLRQEEPTSSVGYVLHRRYNLDGTHTNSAILSHLEAAIGRCGCDLSLL